LTSPKRNVAVQERAASGEGSVSAQMRPMNLLEICLVRRIVEVGNRTGMRFKDFEEYDTVRAGDCVAVFKLRGYGFRLAGTKPVPVDVHGTFDHEIDGVLVMAVIPPQRIARTWINPDDPDEWGILVAFDPARQQTRARIQPTSAEVMNGIRQI